MATVQDSYTTIGALTATESFGGARWAAQTFKATKSYTALGIKLRFQYDYDPQEVTVAIRATSSGYPYGSDLASGVLSTSSLISSPSSYTTTFTYWEFDSSINISSGEFYAIIYSALVTGLGYSGKVIGNSSALITGTYYWSTNSGVDWSTIATDSDMHFQVMGTPVYPTDKIYSKSLVAIANDEIWWEESSGTMAEITAANANISTASPLTVAYGFQKLFIANEETLKVLDFANDRLETGEIGSAGVSVPVRTAVLSGQTSGAGMVCDFVTASTGSAYLYGTLIGTTAFVSGETVVDIDSTTSVSFSLISASLAASTPHFYDWKPYANDTTNYGSLPEQAYIICRYRGRLVLAGHPNYPHQWYMSKIGDPFNWVYGTADPLSAVVGNNADAGELGDIVRALIPYGDDYLVFGCANSIHLLTGDPASGGSIDELSNETGIFSPWSWCKDDNGNLYFWGNNGIYRMDGGRSKPVNISMTALPNLKTDWAVDPSSHRIVLTYVSEKNAVLIVKSTFGTGANEAYWYKIDLDAWYPCSFPNACGIFSANYYNADTATNRRTVLGCNDGYLRYFDDSSKDDDAGASDSAISAYMVLPIESLSGDEDKEGKLSSLTFVNAGGAISGSYSDSDGFVYEIHIGDDAETVLEDIKDGATAFITVAITTPGRQVKNRTKVKGNYLGIKIINDNSSEAFAINKIVGDVKPTGRVR